MRYFGKISDPKDLVTKEYVDSSSSGSSSLVGLSAGFVKTDGSGGLSSVATVDTASIAEQAVTASKIGADVTYSTIGLTLNQVRTIYIGTATPSNSTGNDGDIYIKYNT